MALALAACGELTSVTSTRPTGIYALGYSNETPDSAVISQSFVDGWVLRLSWKDIETTQDSYNFSKIDAAIVALQPYGKKLTLVIFALEVPTYILNNQNQPVVTYTAAGPLGPVTTVVPWDATALSRWEAFCQALSEHLVQDSQSNSMVALRNHPVLAQVDAQIVGLGGVRDIDGLLVATLSYNRATFTNAVLGSIHAIVDRFPNQFRYLAFFNMEDTTTSPQLGQHLFDTLMTTFNTGATPKLGFFQENLACDTPGILSAFALNTAQDQTFSMFQMLQSWVNPLTTPALTDPCLSPAPVNNDRTTAVSGPEVAIAYAYNTFGTRYFEIYRDDLTHPGFADEFTTWHDVLFPTQ